MDIKQRTGKSPVLVLPIETLAAIPLSRVYGARRAYCVDHVPKILPGQCYMYSPTL